MHRASLAVGADDIRRVASTYLDEAGLTIGWSLPRPGRPVTVLLPVEARPRAPRRPVAVAADRPLAIEVPGGVTTLADFHPRRVSLPNGMRLLTERRAGEGVVALELFVDAGQEREAKPGLAYLTGRLLEEGTETRTAEELASVVEDAGGGGSASRPDRGLAPRPRRGPRAGRSSGFRPGDPADVPRRGRRHVAPKPRSRPSTGRSRDDPAFLADALFRSLVYGDHPIGRDPRGAARDVGRLAREDVVAHHARHFTPGNSFLVAVGDFDPKGLERLVKRHFGPWSARSASPPSLPKLVRSSRPKVRRVPRPGEQVHLLIGHLGVARTHRDFDALTILDHILGTGPGFTDRLSRVIRDELGLA